MSERQFIATLRSVYGADDELEAALMANEFQEAIADKLDEGETVDVTQVIPYSLPARVEPAEVVELLRRCRDVLIMTRIVQCFELAKDLDRTAWVLEHRQEESFDISGYDYGKVFERADELLGRKK